MDGIKKYTKEWFTLNGNKDLLEKAKNLEGKGLSDKQSTLSRSVFEGTLEDAQTKLNKLKGESRGIPSAACLQTESYGLENIFNVLDADNDGIVTNEEINDIAALYSEDDSQDDNVLSTEDLEAFYQNAMAAVNSSFETNENETKFNYENGTTLIKTDDNGNIINKEETTKNQDGTTTVKNTNGNNEIIISSYDKDGNLVSKNEDYEGVLNDKTTTYKYNEDGTKTETLDTMGKTVVTKYDKDGNIASKKTEVKYDSDGEIGNTEQRTIGDCWVLAGVNALNFSEKGQQIIKDAITHNDDGSVTVKLVGGDKEYTFSAEEIVLNQYGDGSMAYSSGDTDMNLIEMAISQYRKENYENDEATVIGLDRAHHKPVGATVEDPLSTGMVDEAIYLLTGTNSEYWINPRIINYDKKAEKLLDKVQNNSEDYAATCSFISDDTSITDGKIVDNHVYSIQSVDDDYVYVVNPWDSSKTISYPRDKFVDNLNELSLTDLEEATTASVLDSEKTSAKIEETVIHALGKVDSTLRPKISEGIDKAKDLYEDGKEFVDDAVDKAKDLYEDGKEFVEDVIDKAKDLYEDGKEFVDDKVDKAKDLYEDGKDFVEDKIDDAKSWWKKFKSSF